MSSGRHFEQVETKIWESSWFDGLTDRERVAWFYLLTNPGSNMAGLFKLRLGVFAEYIHCSTEEAEAILAKFEADGVIRYDGREKVVWLVNRVKYRKRPGKSFNAMVARNIETTLKDNSKSFLTKANIFRKVIISYMLTFHY